MANDNQAPVGDNSAGVLTWINGCITQYAANQATPLNATADLVNKQENGVVITKHVNEKRRLQGGAGPQGTNPSSATSQNPNVGAFYGV